MAKIQKRGVSVFRKISNTKQLAKTIAGIDEEGSQNKAGKMIIDGVVSGCCEAYGSESCPLPNRHKNGHP